MGSRLYASNLQEPVIILASTVQRASREAAYSGGRGGRFGTQGGHRVSGETGEGVSLGRGAGVMV